MEYETNKTLIKTPVKKPFHRTVLSRERGEIPGTIQFLEKHSNKTVSRSIDKILEQNQNTTLKTPETVFSNNERGVIPIDLKTVPPQIIYTTSDGENAVA